MVPYEQEGIENDEFNMERLLMLIESLMEGKKESFRGLVHPDDLNRAEWEIAQQQKDSEKNLEFIRYRIIRKDGEVRWLEDVGYLETSNSDDVPEMFYVFVWDITDTLTEAQKNRLIRESEHFIS